jgi:hypothetical protein
MRFATIHRDETLESLTKRVYAFPGRVPAAVLRAAREALVAANPFLAADPLPADAFIAVPELAGAKPGKDTVGARAVARRDVVPRLRAGAELARQRLAAQLGAEQGDVKLLTAKEKAVRPAAQARAKAAKELEAYANEAFAELDSDLAELARALG